MNCKKCNKSIPDDSIFCAYCGIRQVPKPPGKKKRGNGQGSVYRYKDGWRAIVTIGYKPDGKRITKSQCFEKKTDAIMSLSTLKNSYVPRQIKPGVTFEECFEKMMVSHRNTINEKTEENYYFIFKKFESISFLPIDTIKTDMLQDCVDRVNTNSTKEKMKAIASLTFKFASANDIVSKNYAEYIKISREKQTEVEPFTKDEVRKILSAVGTVDYADYIAVLIFTGMRPGEMFELTKDDYFGDHFIGGIKTAAGKNRLIPIPELIQPMVQARVDKADKYIFCSPDGKKMDASHFRSRHFYPAIEQIGVRKLTPYSCRHTFATLMKDVNAPLTDKQRLMGHTSFSMTARYTHTDLESLAYVSNSIANSISNERN